MTTASAVQIEYQGPGVASELWGGTQANFIVWRDGQAAREAAVLLNDAAARHLAETLGQENTQDFRTGAARIVGREVIMTTWQRYNRLDPVVMVSAADVREHPEWVDAARSALAARAAQLAEEPDAESAHHAAEPAEVTVHH